MSTSPNILLLFTDQQRFDTIAALGNPVIRTPHLDRLTREGVAFTGAYSASPVCVSARCSLHYGQYPQTTGCYDNSFKMPVDRPSFMGLLTRAGYRTHGIGKCHFTPDPYALRGFQSRETQEELVADPERDDYLRWLRAEGASHITDPHGVRGEMYYHPQPAQMPARLHPTQWVGDRATAFLRDPARSSQPWCLFASFIHPHPPFAPPAPWHKLYRAPLMPLPNLPPDCEALQAFINRNQNRYKYRDQGYDLNLVRSMRAYYYACVSFIDFQVGRILAELETSGQLDSTLILFTSDHGELLGDYRCFGKRSFHDACARVPLLARLPGRFAAGTRCNTPANTADVAPTILAAAGADVGALKSDGVDLAELARGNVQREAVFAQFNRGAYGIYTAISARWKLAYSAPDGREFLFDRVEDPQETRDRAGLCFCRDAQQQMRILLQAFLREKGETAAFEGDNWCRGPQFHVPDNPDAGLLLQDHPWADQHLPGYST